MAPPALQAMRIRVAGDLEVAVPSRVNLMTPYVLLEQEDWFEDEIGFVRRCMAPGMRALDIGANYGLYTLALARAVGPTGRVWAVEPASTTAAFLSESVTLNGLQQVTVLQLALSDRDGLARLRLDDNAELNSLTAGEGHGEEVRLTTLENLAAATGCSALDFIKLDAEGEEERIVSGGSGFLSRDNPLVMFEIKHGDKLNLGLVQALGTLGYSTYRLVPGPGVLVPWDPQAGTDAFPPNLFACPRTRCIARVCSRCRGSRSRCLMCRPCSSTQWPMTGPMPRPSGSRPCAGLPRALKRNARRTSPYTRYQVAPGWPPSWAGASVQWSCYRKR